MRRCRERCGLHQNPISAPPRMRLCDRAGSISTGWGCSFNLYRENWIAQSGIMRSNVLLVVFICLMATLAQDPDIFSPQPIAECKPVRMVKNVQIRDATVNVDDLVPTLDRIVFILSERAAECGAECLSSVILQMTGSKVWSPIIIGIRKHDASIDSILAIPFQPRLLILQSRFDSDSGMSPHGWSFADILDANHYGERFSDRKFIGVRDRSQCDPSTLIYSQSLAHDVAFQNEATRASIETKRAKSNILFLRRLLELFSVSAISFSSSLSECS